MIRRLLEILLILSIQIFIIEHLELSYFLVPYFFIITVLNLPVYLSKTAQVFIAFCIGLVVDIFSSSLGLHTSACLWLIIFRMFILRFVETEELLLNKLPLTLKTVSIARYSAIASTLTVFYHLYIILLGTLSGFHLFDLLITTLLSSTFTLFLIFFYQFVFYKDV